MLIQVLTRAKLFLYALIFSSSFIFASFRQVTLPWCVLEDFVLRGCHRRHAMSSIGGALPCLKFTVQNAFVPIMLKKGVFFSAGIQ
jgi:hypothetical protein